MDTSGAYALRYNAYGRLGHIRIACINKVGDGKKTTGAKDAKS